MKHARVLITLGSGTASRRGVPFPVATQKQAYAEAVAAAGGVPLWVGPTEAAVSVEAYLEVVDALVVTGGAFDIPPEAYGETPRGRIDRPEPARTHFERALLEGAIRRDLPVLGVCGGMQLLAVVFGGSLHQDIGTDFEEALEHEQPTSPATPWHSVHLEGPLLTLLGTKEIDVCSTHHQAVRAPGAGLEVLGTAPDGVIEAIGSPDLRRLGVQWHPELQRDATCAALYRHLVRLATAA